MANILNIDELRAATTAAVQEAAENAECELQTRARQIFKAGINVLIEQLKLGRKSGIIMGLKQRTDYDVHADSSYPLKPERLKGVSQIVFALTAELFGRHDVSLDYWSKTVGKQRDENRIEGFNIVVHWSDAVGDRLAQRTGDQVAQSLLAVVHKVENDTADMATAILKQIPAKVKAESARGQRFTAVMTLRAPNDYETASGQYLNPDWLKPVARAVWDACHDLKPEIQYWSKPRGGSLPSEMWSETGFEIVIHW